MGPAKWLVRGRPQVQLTPSPGSLAPVRPKGRNQVTGVCVVGRARAPERLLQRPQFSQEENLAQ